MVSLKMVGENLSFKPEAAYFLLTYSECELVRSNYQKLALVDIS